MEHSRRRLTLAALAVTAVALLAACGDDDDKATGTAGTTAASTSASTGGASTSSGGTGTTTATSGSGGSGGSVGSQQDYIDAAEASIQFDDEDLRGCVAEALVSDDVYAAIKKAGLTVDDFKSGEKIGDLKINEDEATSVAGGMAACGDLLPQILSDDEDQLSCATKSLSNDQVAKILSYSLFGVDMPEDLQAANATIEQCVQSSGSSAVPPTS
jgi:hypothetical protein